MVGAALVQRTGEGLSARGREQVLAVFGRSGVLAYPTETYYGLGASPFDRAALERLLTIKGERGSKPLPLVLASTASTLRVAGLLPAMFHVLARHFWPGPLTLVVPAHPDLAPAVTGDGGTVGIRVPGAAIARELASLAGGALTSTSANRSGAPPPSRPGDVAAALGADPDLLIDGGPTPGGPASTVLDLSQGRPRLLRAGTIRAEEIERVLGVSVTTGGEVLPLDPLARDL